MGGSRLIRWLLALLLVVPAAAAAAEPFSECRQTFAERPAGFEPAKCFYDVARRSGLWETAREHLEERLGQRPDLPWLSFYLASIAEQLGHKDTAQRFADAADAFQKQGDTTGETYSRINRARWLARAGELDAAITESLLARMAAQSDPNPALALEVDMLEIRFRFLRGDERVALQDDLLSLRQKLPSEASYGLRRDVLSLLATTAYELGEDRAALGHWEDLAKLASEAGDRPALAAFELNALWITLARSVGERWHREAERQATRVLQASKDAGVPAIEASAILTLGRLADGAAGKGLLEEGLALARRLGDPALERDALAYLALRQLDDPARALELADTSLAVGRQVADPLSLATNWHEQFAVRWRALGLQAALEHADSTFELLESASSGESSDSGRARLFSVWSEAYYWLAGRLLDEYLDSGDRRLLEWAFEVQERMRARLLGAAAATDGQPAPPLLGLGEVEAALGANEALLSFQLARHRDGWGLFAGGAWLTVSTRAGTEVFPIPDLTAMEPSIDMLLALIDRRDGSQAEAARALYGQVLEACLDSLPVGIERLILLPDGLFHLVPFAALPDAAGTLLGERFELVQIPSVTVWQRLRQMRSSSLDTGIVAVVDPLSGPAPAVVSGLRAWLPDREDYLGPLPFAHREGRALRRRFGKACRVLAGTAASEPAVKAELADSGLAHFATHALVDTRSPERSAIVLAQGENDDGLLNSQEIATLDLAGPLVVLSTCESAAGPVMRGEGAMSLARSFFRGGARTVVASLWRLQDREAAQLFDRFYRHLSRGASVSRALKAAQRDRARGGAPAKAWAGLTVLGDGAWVPFPEPEPRRGPRLALALGILGCLVLACLGLLALRRLHPSRPR